VGVAPMNISLTDPAARWTAAPGGPAFYAYSTNYLIDIHAGVIVDVEAAAAHLTEETDATKTMIDRVKERFDLKPRRLIGDTAYGSAAMLGWLVDEKQIEPHILVCDKTQGADSAFSAHKAMRCAVSGARSPLRVPTSPRPTPLSIVLGNPIARPVH
jgi:hypothetical protein